MESSKDFPDGEECNTSSESGWTMYLCSPKHSDESDVYDFEYVSQSYKHEDEVESDDSMASDASSGPIRLKHLWDNGEVSHTMYVNKVQAEKKNGGKCFSNKKAKYQKQANGKSVYTAIKAEVSVKGNGKAGKNSWFGKRK